MAQFNSNLAPQCLAQVTPGDPYYNLPEDEPFQSYLKTCLHDLKAHPQWTDRIMKQLLEKHEQVALDKQRPRTHENDPMTSFSYEIRWEASMAPVENGQPTNTRAPLHALAASSNLDNWILYQNREVKGYLVDLVTTE
jgi:hypothetical protein